MLDAFFTSIDESVWAPHRDRKETVGGKLLVHGKSFPKLKKKETRKMKVASTLLTELTLKS
ncbi:MAG: hypothetical protein ACK49A_09485 [Bacteroidota bacterium]